MATTYQTPGVYVEEVDKGTKPIQVLGASMPAFIGFTAQASNKDPITGAPIEDGSVLGEATLVTNWTQYQAIYGGFVEGAYLPDAIYGFFNNGGSSCYVTSLRALEEIGDRAKVSIPASGKPPADGEKSGGSAKPAFDIVAKFGGSIGNSIIATITADKKETEKAPDTFTLAISFPTITGINQEVETGLQFFKEKGGNYLGRVEDGKTDITPASFSLVEIKNVTAMPNLISDPQPFNLQNGGANADVTPLKVEDFVGNEANRTGLGGASAQEAVRLLVCPDLMPNKPYADLTAEDKERIIGVQKEMVAQCERLKYRFAILDTPRGMNAQQAGAWRTELGIDSSYAGLYYPWVKVPDMSESSATSRFIPPSGHVAGVYGRVDSERGVHKAPANEAPLGVIGLEINLTKGEQDLLNPNGVNCLRRFSGGRGIKIWGARTLSKEGAWRYINVRRLFIVIAASMDEGLQWVVFEPNDRILWSRVRRDITAFLSTFWLNGALFGSTQDESFYVKVDDELNPPAIRDLGQLIIEVGISPVKPAEFVIVRLSQWAGPNAEA